MYMVIEYLDPWGMSTRTKEGVISDSHRTSLTWRMAEADLLLF